MFEQTHELGVAQSFAIALLIGALVGVEREKKKADTQRRQAVAFGQGAADNQVRILRQKLQAVEVFRIIFHVGFIQHHNDMGRHFLHEGVKFSFFKPRAGRIVRIGNED